jgi:NADPH2:quinone reductase
MRQLADWYAEGRVKPHISGRYRLDQAAEALRLMADRKVAGKIILTP